MKSPKQELDRCNAEIATCESVADPGAALGWLDRNAEKREILKPYYEHAGITIYCGDCREIIPCLTGVDLCLVDPPYGIAFDTNYTRFTSGFSVERIAHKAIHGDDKPFDPAVLMGFPKIITWGANCYSDRLPMGSWLVWDKRHTNGAAFLADAEVAWMKGGHGIYIYAQVWQGCLRADPIQHPTQKPLGLMAWCIAKANLEADALILDPYMGSGTTLRAAKDAGYRAIGIEIEERYCEIAANRLRQEVLFGAEVPA